jgi:tetratricopeptide (TPR) repeat protein
VETDVDYRVLVNDSVKKYVLKRPPEERARLAKAFEFLESGLWDGGLRVKKLRGVSRRTVFEGRLDRGNRLIFTLGSEPVANGPTRRLIRVWGVVHHDDVDAVARTVVPEDAPFLHHEPEALSEMSGADLDELAGDVSLSDDLPPPDAGRQRWFVLNEREWRRMLLHREGDFEVFLHLTAEQRTLLESKPPLLISGTAGSGKSTLAIYHLLRPELLGKSKLFVTYNRHLRNFAERLYRGLTVFTETSDPSPPRFLTFAELCREMVPGVGGRFPPDREVDVFRFGELFRRHPRGDRLDYALVWEEIRSIIKGAKPQIHPDGFENLVARLKRGGADSRVLRGLQEELLSLRGLGIGEQLGQICVKQFRLSLEELGSGLEELVQTRNAELVRTLETLARRLRRGESDLDASLLTLPEYERLGRKRAPTFREDRAELHSIANWYDEQAKSRRLWDEIDLTRAALRALEQPSARPPAFDFVACDEVQDLTDVQLSLLIRLPENPRRVLLAGDPKQIVNPSGFRWEEARRLFFDRRLPVPEVQHLTLNFRCAGSIVLLSNALLELKRRLLGIQSDEKLDRWLYQGRPPCLVEGVSPGELLEQIRLAGADRMILTRSEGERDRLKKELDTELVMTIREAKGLEFSSVLLWKFAEGAEEIWSAILRVEAGRLREARLRHEINLLYVGVTRARHSLVVYDGAVPSRLWESEALREHFFRTPDLDYLVQAWRRISSPDEWAGQGDYFLEHEHYRAAAECYRNANRERPMRRALAMEAERTGQHAAAADHWIQAGQKEEAAGAYERADELERARLLWLDLGDEPSAERCRLKLWEREARHDELAAHWESRGDLEKAAHHWRKARRPDKAAPLFKRIGKAETAAQCYEEAGAFRRSASLYEKCRRPVDAARCWENAREWEKAVRLWTRLKRYPDLLRCLRAVGDPVRLGRYFEERREWESALEQYREAWSPDLQARFETDLAGIPARGRDHNRRALRLELLGRTPEAAEAWERGGGWDRAAACHASAGDSVAEARCLEKAGRWMEAVERYVRLPGQDQRPKDLRRCLRRTLDVDSSPPSRARLGRLAHEAAADGRRDAALAVHEALGNTTEAAVLALLEGDRRKAGRLYRRENDPLAAAHAFLRLRGHSAGAEFFAELLRRDTVRRWYADPTLSVAYELVVRHWLSNPPDGDIGPLRRHLRVNSDLLTQDFAREVLETTGLLDDAYYRGVLYGEKKRNRLEERRLREEAARMEAEGLFDRAALRRLWLEERDEASRLLEKVPIDDDNLNCHSSAGRWREVTDYLERNGRPFEAARIALVEDDPDRAVDLIRKSGDLEKGADLLERFRRFPAALEFFRETGNRRKEAEMLERTKSFEEAAEIWAELGDASRRQKCLQRLARRRNPRQRSLFGSE